MSWHLTVGETALAGTAATLAGGWLGYRAQRFVARFNRDTQRERARADRNWKKKEEVYSRVGAALWAISGGLGPLMKGDSSDEARNGFLATEDELGKVIPDFKLFAPEAIYDALLKRNKTLSEIAGMIRLPLYPDTTQRIETKAKQADKELLTVWDMMRDDLRDSD